MFIDHERLSFEISWIMHYFYLADKDASGTLTKEECRCLLLDTLNAKVSNDEFEKIFRVMDKFFEVCRLVLFD